jgi:hypothetical protein
MKIKALRAVVGKCRTRRLEIGVSLPIWEDKRAGMAR